MDFTNSVNKRFRIFLIVISSLMLGFSYPPFQIGVFAAFAFVPFFIAFESIDNYGTAFRYSYLWLIIIHIIALYWTGGFTHCKDYYLIIAGILLIIFHPFFYLPAIAAFVFIRKQYGFKISILSFPLVWLSIEYSRTLTQFAFPWLTLGNTQTYDLSVIQITEITGVYGLSFWLLVINVLSYYLYAKLTLKEWKYLSARSIQFVIIIIIIYFLPKIYGIIKLQNCEDKKLPVTKSTRIGIVQPNIDPFEKWEGFSDWQLKILQDLTHDVSKYDVDLVIWPETAVPFYLLHPVNKEYFDLIKNQVDILKINLLTGVPDIIYYPIDDRVPKSSKLTSDGQKYDTFNSTILLQHDSNEITKYAKMILVPFSERVPYSEELHFLNAMQWNFGLGGWGIGADTTIFHFQQNDTTTVSFCNLICYESIYPGFVANFVRKGAEFITVITNDSWWGNTSGAYQHAQYAILRAVENRRWVIRCANGGISCFINPNGEVLYPAKLFERTIVTNRITLNRELTFFSKHGDWFPEICVIVLSFVLASGTGKKIYYKIKKSKENEIY